MPYHIVKKAGKFVVEKQDGSKTFGTHDTEAEAKKQMAALYAVESKARGAESGEEVRITNDGSIATQRHLHLLGATSAARTETIDGREFLVVPVVALMEGVIHAVNAETPEFVSASVLTKGANTFTNRPCSVGHPKKDGKQCSVDSSPEILEAHGFGKIRSAVMKGAKLFMETLIDPLRLKALKQEQLLADLKEGKPVEVSVGAYVVTNDKENKWNGKPYVGEWLEILGDHLAFLPGGRGACSMEMGCGAHRAAMRVCEDHLEDVEEIEALGALPDKAEVEVQGDKKMKVGDKVKVNKPGHAAHGKTGTITSSTKGGTVHKVGDHGEFHQSELRAAADAEPDSEEVAELIAYNTMRTILDSVGDQWDEVSKLVDSLIAAETDDPTETDEEEAAEEDVETATIDSIKAICSSMSSALSSITGITYSPALSDSPRYMEDLKTAAGARHSVTDMKAIQAVHDHSMALGAVCDRSNYKLLEHKSGNGKAGNDPTSFYIETVRKEARK